MSETIVRDRWLKVIEVADRLSMHKDDVYELIRNGDLPATKVSERRTRIKERDLVEFMERRSVVQED